MALPIAVISNFVILDCDNPILSSMIIEKGIKYGRNKNNSHNNSDVCFVELIPQDVPCCLF